MTRILFPTIPLILGLLLVPLVQEEEKKPPKQETKQEASSTNQEDQKEQGDEEAKKEDKEPERTAQQMVVKRMMRAVHRGPHSPMVQFEQVARDKAKADWDKLAPLAEWIYIMGVALDQEADPDPDSYMGIAKELKKAITDKDLEVFKKSVTRFSRCCGQCHGWSPPQ